MKKIPRLRKTTAPKSKRGAVAAELEKARVKAEFLTWYEQGGAIYWASAKAGTSPDTIGRWREADPEFDTAVLIAYQRSTDNLKMTAYLRAVKGSDNLAMFLIKQRDPSFREHYGIDARHMHGGVIATPNKVPASIQAAVDQMALDLVIKMAEKL